MWETRRTQRNRLNLLVVSALGDETDEGSTSTGGAADKRLVLD